MPFPFFRGIYLIGRQGKHTYLIVMGEPGIYKEDKTCIGIFISIVINYAILQS